MSGYTQELLARIEDQAREIERLKHAAAEDLLTRLVAQLTQSGAENYQESTFELEIGSESLEASVTLRHRGKPSAHELRVSAEQELAALKAQPSGVVLPERKEHPKSECGHTVFDPSVRIHNELLDEIARLNSSPVSVGGVDDRAAFKAWCQKKYEPKMGKDWRCVMYKVNHGDKAFSAFKAGAEWQALTASPK